MKLYCIKDSDSLGYLNVKKFHDCPKRLCEEGLNHHGKICTPSTFFWGKKGTSNGKCLILGKIELNMVHDTMDNPTDLNVSKLEGN